MVQGSGTSVQIVHDLLVFPHRPAEPGHVRRILSLHAFPALVAVLVLFAGPHLGSADAGTFREDDRSAVKARTAVANPASAFPVQGAAITAAKRIAVEHWGRDACGGQVELRWTRLALGTNATASWRNPTDPWNDPAANFDCRIDLSTAADFDYTKLCTVVVHEMGHLNGRPHDAKAGRLMSAFYTSPIAGCRVAPGKAARAASSSRKRR
jgi:hypothetical protein